MTEIIEPVKTELVYLRHKPDVHRLYTLGRQLSLKISTNPKLVFVNYKLVPNTNPLNKGKICYEFTFYKYIRGKATKQ